MTEPGALARLSRRLDRHRDALRTLPGVVGLGIGPRRPGDPTSDVVIQIFVRSERDVSAVRAGAAAWIAPGETEVFVAREAGPLNRQRTT